MVSLFYGEGDIVRTIKIGTLAGWDSDNPTATWGGLLGFMLGKEGIEKAFARENVSDIFWIHRTRRNFPDYLPYQKGEITFQKMAQMGVEVADRIIVEDMSGAINENYWFIKLP